VPTGPAAIKETSDAALIAEVVATLRDDSAAAPPLTVATPLSENPVHALLLFSEQLPGMAFSPWVYFDTAGPVYLAESFDSITFHGTDQTIHASWIPARASFSQWSKTADAPSAQPR
jgi:hypothetical protein